MSFSGTFLRTKVARRILGLFMLSALLPIAALAIISYHQVTGQLYEQNRHQLRELSRTAGTGILERLDLLSADLQLVALALDAPSRSLADTLPVALRVPLESKFRGVVLIGPAGSHDPVFGSVAEAPAPSDDQSAHLATGRSLLANAGSAARPALFLARAIDPHDVARGLVWGEVDLEHLMHAGTGGTLPTGVSMCVLTDSRSSVYCPASIPPSALADLRQVVTSPDSARLDWAVNGEDVQASYWSMFLGYQYGAPDWTIVLSRPKADILGPLMEFKRTFVFVILLAVGFVFLFSNVEIRKNLRPLEELKKGTLRIAEGRFEEPVTVESRDEFEDLAHAFNDMSRSLALQFDTLTAISDIDHAVLSAFDKKRTVDTVLGRAREAVGCDSVSMSLFRSVRSPSGSELRSSRWVEGAGMVAEGALPDSELEELHAHPGNLILDGDADDRTYLEFGGNLGYEPRRFVVLPMRAEERISGVLVLGYGEGAAATAAPRLDRRLSDEVRQGRQLADQIAVAMSNTKLVEELDELSWGAITAFARAVDAKSAWTAGHSERVTELALTLGRELRLSEYDLQRLNRGALLHDIGKIGVPGSVLDKRGRLTEEEFAQMRSHAEIGARILEPIEAFAPSLGIVLHHHERWDGGGYPHGLCGEEIPYLARVLSVADVYDALTSDRPYRKGFSPAKTLGVIRSDSATHFDPDLVRVFLEVMNSRGLRPEGIDPRTHRIQERATA